MLTLKTSENLFRLQEFCNAFISIVDCEHLAKIVYTLKKQKNNRGRPLNGIPIVVKDNINTIDFPTTGGTLALDGRFPKKNASIIDQIVNAGGVIVGKTNMHELSLGVTSNNTSYGAVLNPLDYSRMAGGSSGGSAAAVSSGVVPLGLGTDTGGSVRIPASFCGICGFRPTTGRYPSDGLINLSYTNDTVGLMSNNIAGILLLDTVITNNFTMQDIDLKDMRFGIPRNYFYDDLEPEVENIINKSLEYIKRIGSTIVECSINGVHNFYYNDTISQFTTYEIINGLPKYILDNEYDISMDFLVSKINTPDVRAILDTGAD